jgi:hypothetical protein
MEKQLFRRYGHAPGEGVLKSVFKEINVVAGCFPVKCLFSPLQDHSTIRASRLPFQWLEEKYLLVLNEQIRIISNGSMQAESLNGYPYKSIRGIQPDTNHLRRPIPL